MGPDGDTIMSKESYGGCQMVNNSLGDTLKGSQTDAAKKALSYFGLGEAAFKGKIDDQLRAFFFYTDTVMDKIGKGLQKAHNIKAEIKNDLKMRYIRSVTEKSYDDFGDITEDDWKKVDKELDTLLGIKPTVEEKPKKKPLAKKKAKKDEPKSSSGEDQVPADEKQMDNPFPDDERAPF